MQDHRPNIIGDVGALQCIVIEHWNIHAGLDDDRGGNFLHLILYLQVDWLRGRDHKVVVGDCRPRPHLVQRQRLPHVHGSHG